MRQTISINNLEGTVDDEKLLDRVRKLLAKAEAEGCTEQEAGALTAKAAELMAKYGIDQALLDAAKPSVGNKPADRKIVVPSPYASLKGNLLYDLAGTMRCRAIQLSARSGNGVVMHVFGFRYDIERMEVLYTSLLLQMTHQMLRVEVPYWATGSRKVAFRRSWMIGFIKAVVARVEAAENRAKREAEKDTSDGKPGAALVLADRSLAVKSAFDEAYPKVRTGRITYSSHGYREGYASGQQANIGGTSVGRRSARALR
jgi:hypothetical protein